MNLVIRPRGVLDLALSHLFLLYALNLVYASQVVQDSPYFHSSDHIYPLGFRSTRIFWSATKPHARCPYVCQILSQPQVPNKSNLSIHVSNRPRWSF